jgi:beta-galactosidase
MNADAWINGVHLADHPNGYTSFVYDLTDHLKANGENVLAVEVKNIQPNSRWYTGSGIYRHVWLKAFAPIHIANWGTFVTTPEVSRDLAQVRVQTTIENTTEQRAEIELETEIFAPGGESLVSRQSLNRISEKQPYPYTQVFRLVLPRLWSPDMPSLYRAVTTVKKDGAVLDRQETVFGIRSIEFDARKGFLLNGTPMLLKGANLHHDNGPLGAAAYDRAEERKVELMKANGYNAIRCSHNPPSPALLDTCDRIGMLVIDEIFDTWDEGKKANDYHTDFPQWWRRDTESMVLRDRNHPCIILWSIGNEIKLQIDDHGAELAQQLAEAVRSMDSTRPVTAALCRVVGADNLDWVHREPFIAALDVVGYNYMNHHYREDHKRHPDRVWVTSESRGKDVFAYWMDVKDLDYLIGDFVWTGMDHLGEAATGWMGFVRSVDYPWTTSFCGDLDLCGFKRPQSYYRDVIWGKKSVFPTVHNPDPEAKFGEKYQSRWGYPDVELSWTWPGHEGEKLTVEVFSGCQRARLLVNGRDYGTKPTSQATEYKAVWKNIVYEPGLLQVIGYDGVSETAQWTLRTVGKPEAIRLWADRQIIAADGQDLSYVTIEVVDSQGLRIPDAKLPITLELDGAATLIGFGSGNPKTAESFQANCRNTFEGRCLAIIKASNKPGTITVKAAGPELKADALTIEIK